MKCKTETSRLHQENKHITQLLKNCKKNRRDAQKELYKTYYSYAMSICVRYANNKEDAVEILNDSFLKVFKYINSFDKNKSFKVWLRRILINSAIDHFKKNKQGLNEVDIDEAKEASEMNAESIEYQELLLVVQKLPQAYRTVFNLKAIEGYTHEEIAKLLGIATGTSKSNYAKAKKQLQVYLNNYFEV
ncbi:MAG: sigma-70 family RNA polymerase sigma factor [Bacteroidota bacterium]